MLRMIRAGRFKHRLLSEEFMQSPAMDEAIQTIQKARDFCVRKNISDAEWTALYIFILSAYRRPADFLGGPHREAFSDGLQGQLSLSDVQTLLPLKKVHQNPPAQNFLNLFCTHSLRSIPLSVQKSLSRWQHTPQQLQLRSDIPTPQEVMEMQCQGIRCVSLLSDPRQMKSFVQEGRDVLGFIVHDLIHADHFFQDADQAQAQILFSRHLSRMNQTPYIQNLLQQDLEFLGEWHYLISDMNTVPLHLFKTLKAILLAAFKRSHGIPFKNSLPPELEEKFRSEMQLVAGAFPFTDEQNRAWMAVNSDSFRLPEDALLLQQVLQI